MENYEHDQPETVTLWARVGVTINVTREVYEELENGSSELMKDILKGRVGEVYLDGETYFPDIPQNRVLGNMEIFISDNEPLTAPAQEPGAPLDVKVLVDSGVVNAVFKNQNVPVNVEVIDVDPDYEDYDQLRAYEEKVRSDPSLMACEYSVANFEEPEAEQLPDAPSQSHPEPQELPEHVSFMEVVNYCKAQGHPEPDKDEIEWYMQEDDRQHQRDEAVRNNYSFYDLDCWFLLQDILEVQMSFDTAMKISNALWEEDLETLELNTKEDLLEGQVFFDRLLFSLGLAEYKDKETADRLITSEEDLSHLAEIFAPYLPKDRPALDDMIQNAQEQSESKAKNQAPNKEPER